MLFYGMDDYQEDYFLKLLTKANRDLMKEIPVGIPAEICDQRE